MSLRLSIYLPTESLSNSDSLENFISDIGDLLVSYGFGNEITAEESEDLDMDSLNSYIIISSDDDPSLENFQQGYLVVPVNSGEGKTNE